MALLSGPARRRTRAGKIGSVGLYTALGVATVLFLIPFCLVIRNALATEKDIVGAEWVWSPGSIQWGNFKELVDDTTVPFLHSLWVSFEVGVLHTLGTLLLCSLAGYGLARIPYKHANKIFYVVLATLMIPASVTFVPSFVLVSSLGWVSSLRGLIVPGLFTGFTAFLFRQYFLGFPKELEEAARVDGLSYWGAYWRIVVPNSLNFFAAMSVITFISGWNAFLWPLVIGQDQQAWTVQVALSTFVTAQTINIHELFMAAGLSILPLVIVFVFLQRWLVQGVAQTGIKG
jgi:multiple sugar transport system permease protein